MQFISYSFIGFLIGAILIYYIVPGKVQWTVLLAASLFFLYCADPRCLLFTLVTALSAWLLTCSMDRLEEKNKDRLKELSREERKNLRAKLKNAKLRRLLVFFAINLGILFWCKYTNFFLSIFAGESFTALKLFVPLGISFYTFQTVSYAIDVYRGKQKAQKNPLKMLLFVTFFPQLIQGPINRYDHLSKTLFGPHKLSGENIRNGLLRLLWGFWKKLMIADRLAPAVVTLIKNPDVYSGAYVFVAMIIYAFQLYCDFTGGIDIALGAAEMFGVHMAENFKLPYFAKNIKDYWNRWHISMGAFFTDYIFYPVSVSRPMLALSKWARTHLGPNAGKRVTVYCSCFLVWLATGLWHGAAWNYVVWGLSNFVVIMVSQEMEPLYARFHSRFGWKEKHWYGLFEILRMFLLMSCIRMFDCYQDVPLTFRMLWSMLTSFNGSVLFDGSLMNVGLSAAQWIQCSASLLIVLGVSLYTQAYGSPRKALSEKPFLCYGIMSALLVTMLIFGAYGHGYNAVQFIYNQF